jgi:hypothetical protein
MTLPDNTPYTDFVYHPRYGRVPHITGLNPERHAGRSVYIHWHSPKECRIPDTAIEADVSKQPTATVRVTHYFDVIRKCRDCGKSFIFFAQEQKHWYEELGFGLNSDCVRCVPCRKRQQGIAQTRERYEELFHVVNRTTDQNLEMADCCLSLVEEGVFHDRQTERIRMLLNLVADQCSEDARYVELTNRLHLIEGNRNSQHTPQIPRSPTPDKARQLSLFAKPKPQEQK